jgi:hypothetical protein
VGASHLVGQGGQFVEERRDFAAPEPALGGGVNQPGSPVEVCGRQSMINRSKNRALGFVPEAGAAVQFGSLL